MQAIREIVSRDIFTGFNVPQEFGDKFEMILVPLDKNLNNAKTLAKTYNAVIKEDEKEDQVWMKYQEENGFSKNILAQESEEVWNDL